MLASWLLCENGGDDFQALQHRGKAVSIAARQAQHWRRITLLRAFVVFCAILAMLAIQAYRGQGTDALAYAATVGQQDPIEGQTTLALMPYETPGESFPGSAYYYVSREIEPAHPAANNGGGWSGTFASITNSLHLEGEEIPLEAADTPLPNSGPAARALSGLTSTLDRTRALSCLTAGIYYEAASEPDDGQRAVAQVILNRVAHRSFPSTVCGVVYQGSERATGCQFSFTCDGALARKPSAFFWARAEKVAAAALAGYVYTPVGLATHYHTFAIHPYWADSLNFIGQIGAHRFYRFNGMAGSPNAFRLAYSGGEPLPQPASRSTASSSTGSSKIDLANDPVALARAYEAQYRSLNPAAASSTGSAIPASATHATPSFAAPQYTPEALRHGGDAAHRARDLPASDTIRPEYQNSGRWLSPPQ
jgi:spore germination cell wall hydrolase CwlJ-like protein